MGRTKSRHSPRRRRLVCQHKVAYASKQAAEVARRRLWDRQATVVSVYPCGDHWHIGHDRQR